MQVRVSFWLFCLVCLSCGIGCNLRCNQQPLPKATPKKPPSKAVLPHLSLADSLAQLPQTHVEISTPMGNMVVALYNDTPKHREQFLKLLAENAYNGTAFHRIIQGLLIQGGDLRSKDSNIKDDGTRDTSYTIPSEILPNRYHKRGAVGAIRLPDTPQGTDEIQFYVIAADQPVPEKILNDQEQQIRTAIGNSDFRFSDEARQSYLQTGGAPWLDMQFTVFGEVIEGFEVLDRLAALDTPRKLRQKVKDANIIDRPRLIRQTRMKIRNLGEFKTENGHIFKVEATNRIRV